MLTKIPEFHRVSKILRIPKGTSHVRTRVRIASKHGAGNIPNPVLGSGLSYHLERKKSTTLSPSSHVAHTRVRSHPPLTAEPLMNTHPWEGELLEVTEIDHRATNTLNQWFQADHFHLV